LLDCHGAACTERLFGNVQKPVPDSGLLAFHHRRELAFLRWLITSYSLLRMPQQPSELGKCRDSREGRPPEEGTIFQLNCYSQFLHIWTIGMWGQRGSPTPDILAPCRRKHFRLGRAMPGQAARPRRFLVRLPHPEPIISMRMTSRAPRKPRRRRCAPLPG
jgi:hypothetical protein